MIPTGALTILSLAGLAMMLRKHRQSAWMLGSTLLIYPFVHYFVQFEARYRYPIFWATLLPASYAVLEIIRRLRSVPPESLVTTEKKNKELPRVEEAELVVRKKGLEPLRPFGHQLLRLARLPIPPLPRGGLV